MTMIDEKCVVLVIILYVIGMMLKDTKKIKDNYIPIILGIVSIPIGIMFCWSDVVNGIVQGIMCAGMAVYGNQIYKQLEKKN